MVDQLTITAPDDWHVHLRDEQMLQRVVADTARSFRRAIVMPNLRPPVTTVAAAQAYRDRIQSACPEGVEFTPLMTAYLTDDISPEEIERGFLAGVFTAAKLYPANATTNSAAGVTDLLRLDPVLACMARIGMPLLIHGEVTDAAVDVFDREATFIERHLKPLRSRHPDLRIVFEHITTEQAVDFVGSADRNLAATITPHHLHINRNAMFAGGLRSDFYCLPVAKRERIVWHCVGPPPAVTHASSWVRIQPPTSAPVRKAPAVAPASSTPPMPWKVMPRCSMRRTPWISWRLLPAGMARPSTACR